MKTEKCLKKVFLKKTFQITKFQKKKLFQKKKSYHRCPKTDSVPKRTKSNIYIFHISLTFRVWKLIDHSF